MEAGSNSDRKRSGRPSIDEETVDAVRVAFHRSPRKSIRVASNELVYQTNQISLFINAWPTRSFAIRIAAGFHEIFKASLNAVSMRKVLSKLISKFTLYCNW